MFGELKHTSARATPELVGRRNVLEKIKQAILDRRQPYLIEITGDGGIGKTRLVEHVLEKLVTALNIQTRVAKYPVDLYHTRTHSREGLLQALYDALEGTEHEFPTYRAKQRELERISDLAELNKQRDELVTAFLNDLNKIGRERRLVFALDTTERLFFESDPIQQRLGLEEEKIAVLNWLLRDFLPRIENAVVLLSGRTERGSLREDLQKIQGKKFLPIDLQGLTEDEALEYFDAVIRACKETGELQDLDAAASIEKLTPDQRRVMFYSLCDANQGTLTIRPIWLALAIDYWVSAEQLLPEWEISLQDALTHATQDHTATRNALGKKLFGSLRASESPADEVILALSLATKGADADLLLHILGGDKTEIEKALQVVRHLSFVKIRPTDERFFLHDEMYTLLQRHGWGLDTSEARAKAVLEQIVDWYNTRIDNHRREITRLYEQHEKTFYATPEVTRERVALQDAWVEDLHYQLRLDPRRGFETYFRYSDDAIAAGNEALDAQLRSELLTFWRTHDPNWEKSDIQGLRRADVEADAAIRWMKRFITRGEYHSSLSVAQKLRDKAKDIITRGGYLAQAELDTWEGLVYTYIAKFEQAEPLLERGITTLESGLTIPASSKRRSGILARAYNNLGYFARLNGQMHRAAVAYLNALPYWRDLDIQSEHANTLNNLAYALALQGKFAKARRQATDALQMRERMGPSPAVVLSLTTLAEIEIYGGRYQEARSYAERGLELAQELHFSRGEGLARLALTALCRFQAEPEQTRNLQQRQKLLQDSINHSEHAINIFAQAVKEPVNLMRAYYERALTLREQCHLMDKNDSRRFDTAEEADKFFEQVINEAQKRKQWDMYLDARLGQLWMHYRLQSPNWEQRLNALNEEIQHELPDYLIQPTRYPGVVEKTILGVFSQLARYHIIKGILALDKNDLREAGRQFALGFEYDRFIGEDFRDLNRGINVVHSHLRGFNPRELVEVFDGAASALGTLMPQSIAGRIKEKGDLLFWQELEAHFGAYVTYTQLSSQAIRNKGQVGFD
jgi:tetratricopeptide (TPR) repeat protein